MKNKNVLVVVGLIVLALAGGFYYLSSVRDEQASLSPDEVEKSEEELTNREDKRVEETVKIFMDTFVSINPAEPESVDLTEAVSLLSEGAKGYMEVEPTTGDLAALVGVQDIPDGGYSVGEITYKDNIASNIENGLAEIEVRLNYSGGQTSRVFLLSKVGDEWQIDAIKPTID